MTRAHSGEDAARRINDAIPGAAVDFDQTAVWVKPESILESARLLKHDESLDFSFLNAVSAVDYIEHFELVYHLLSLRRNSSLVVKSRVPGRENLEVPSVYEVWKGADLQEREVWDLMGIYFDGHPNMKRILLWEGFPGHPLRKDFLG
ncbi:MAG: NADH-quinone oxidoreductase subunit C [Dehalococcoidia bacterium]|nr:NADH-quinone oxidoreductase subunit C [Dehalococcoidia bacterium]